VINGLLVQSPDLDYNVLSFIPDLLDLMDECERILSASFFSST